MSAEDGEEESSGGPKRPNPIDVYVGSRLRLRRMMVGMSQEKLGERMSLTFQQIQKYERGINRIGASRLFELAKVLQVPVQFFYDGAPSSKSSETPAHTVPGLAEAQGENYIVEFLNTRDGLELNRAFMRIADAKVRRAVVELVRSLSGAPEAGS
ncbi:MAG: helix-turn-helix transcriptional regulator [Hyphomicrobiaceae bacterium]|nr:MAG: helix-turn-helix transcriptional regulator [Hyphomicrobiaceae bacterium]